MLSISSAIWTMQAATIEDPLIKVEESRARLALFWAAEAQGFCGMWNALSKVCLWECVCSVRTCVRSSVAGAFVHE